MSVLIKAGAAAPLVRPFAPSRPQRSKIPVEAAAEPVAEDEGLRVLREENAALREALVEAKEAAAVARKEGRQEALEETRLEEDKRLASLEDGVADALAAWRHCLDGLDRLAPLMARAALSKLFDECGDHADFVARMIARQMGRMRRESVVRILVSGQDFPDDEALAALRTRAGTADVELVRDLDLPAGESRMDLSLGHIDLGVRAQWGELSALLLDSALEGPSE